MRQEPNTLLSDRNSEHTPGPSTSIALPRRYAQLALTHIQPGWFSCVMGTGILALTFANSPLQLPFFTPLSMLLWLLATCLLILLLLCWGVHAFRHPRQVYTSLLHPTQAQQWGIPPIACFTVATGFLTIGDELLHVALCLLFARILWIVGVIGGLFATMIVPYLMFTEHKLTTETTYGNWLTSVVPPIGASVSGALLIPHWPAFLQVDMLILNYALWGGGVALAALTICLFYARLVYHKVPQNALVPTVWLVIGPLGQSVTGINALGDVAHSTLPSFGPFLDTFALVYGLLLWGPALYWLAISIMLTLRAWRSHLPFTMNWWSFIYPVGVLTTATYTLYTHTRTLLFLFSGSLLLCLLTFLWLLVSSRTLRLVWLLRSHTGDDNPRPSPVLEQIP